MSPEYGELLKLSVPERIQLVKDLWDSIADETPQLPLADWKVAELRRRKANLLKNPDSAVSWEQVRQELLGSND